METTQSIVSLTSSPFKKMNKDTLAWEFSLYATFMSKRLKHSSQKELEAINKLSNDFITSLGKVYGLGFEDMIEMFGSPEQLVFKDGDEEVVDLNDEDIEIMPSDLYTLDGTPTSEQRTIMEEQNEI